MNETSLMQRKALKDISMKVEQLERTDGYVYDELLQRTTVDALRLVASIES